MSLDVRTLFVTHALVSITLAVLMIVFWRSHRRIPGLGAWTLGSVLFALAVLGIALRGVLPDLFSIVVANGLFVVSLAAVWNGVRLFDDRRALWGGVFAAAAATMAIVAYRTYVANEMGDRIIAVSVVLSVVSLMCAFEIARVASRSLRRVALPAAAWFGFAAVTLAIRAVATFVMPPRPGLLAPGAVEGVNELVSLVGNIVVVFAGLMMAAQRLQNEVEARNIDLDVARIEAEQASRAKSDFLAIMSHELRTPLNAIIGFSEMQYRELLGPLGHPNYRDYAADIHASGKHLLEVITSILDISKADAGTLEVVPVDLDPGLVLDATAPLIREAAAAKSIELAFDLPATPLTCRADPQALKQILVNLLSNAVKFTAEGGRVTAELRALAAGGAEFVVRDTGIGIAAADLPRLMRPFEQATRGYARRNDGTGLGLPLVDALVRLHGGTLHIESAVDVGTAVTVRLPAPV